MLQLRETSNFIVDNYKNEYSNYFAALSKNAFFGMTMNSNAPGKLYVEV